MFITLINDCSDDNARARQTTRWSTLFPAVNLSFVAINSSLSHSATIEAAGNLIDVLDASNGLEGVVALNVAPRGQMKVDGVNGSRFCYFYYRKTLVISTVKDFNLSLVKKFDLVKYINILDTENVLDFACKNKLIDESQRQYINKSQFRSLDFQPRVARWLEDRENIPVDKVFIDKIPNSPKCVWCIDSFGNIKTTLTLDDVKSDLIETKFGKFKHYDRLKDLPDGETAFYTGSSGIVNNRFLEIATQNRIGSASAKLGMQVGDLIEMM